MVWELTFPYEYHTTAPKCVVRIGDAWYDCTAWRNSHPGGAELLDKFHERDGTDVFYALHSQEAVAKLRKMKARPVAPTDPKRDPVSINWEALRKRLEAEGWFERNWAAEFAFRILPTLILCTLGSILATRAPVLASILLGFGFQQAGWIGHDYSHGRGAACAVLGRVMGGVINGFSFLWWSHKHNTHHTFPNRKEHDADIHNEPILHLWFPDAKSDVWYRQYQHLYYPFAFAFLHVSWRLQSVMYALRSHDWVERGLIALGYLWLACLPWYVVISGILLGGFFVAIVVTANHQTEEVLERDAPYNFIIDQFSTTRGVHCGNAFTEWFFGGMQYQLEHHLFPIMPRFRYPALRPIVQKFAAENGLQCHVSGVAEILRMNYHVMKSNAAAKPKTN